MRQKKATALEEKALVAPEDLHIVNPSTKIAIRMFEGVERIVPPAFVGLALAAGAMPGGMFEHEYGQYTNLAGELIGEEQIVHDDEDIEIMEEKKSLNEEIKTEREPMEEDTGPATTEQIVGAMGKILDLIAAKPEQKQRYVTSEGIPKTSAIEAELDKDVTAAMRDAAWVEMHKEDDAA